MYEGIEGSKIQGNNGSDLYSKLSSQYAPVGSYMSDFEAFTTSLALENLGQESIAAL